MKQLADLIQVSISQESPAWLRLVGCMVVLLIVLQTLYLIYRLIQEGGKAFQYGRSFFLKITLWRVLAYLFLSAFMVPLSPLISDGVQELEQRFFSPVYVNSDTSAFVLRCYEMELSRHCSEKEMQVVKSWTEKTAAAIGCTPLDIYQVAFVECSLDPFRVRTDGGAAGWIQFTNTGLDGLGASLADVKAACKRRDTEYIMSLTHDYLTQFGNVLPDAPAVYVAVAAAGHAGQTDAAHVIYTRSQHPNEYRANSALWDGWTVERGKVLRLTRNIDGRITVGDLAGCLAAKKSELLKKY